MSRGAARWISAAGLVAALAACGGWPPRAARADDPAADAPLRYRRVYAPADDIANWPRPNVPYVPIDAQVFEGAVAAASANRAALPARIERAVYSARLEGEVLTAGKAQWTIVHTNRAPAVVLLAPCGLAISRATWEASDVPPVLGNDALSRLVVVAPASGVLECEWTLRGQRDSGGGLAFDWDAPAALQTSLDLDLPEDMALTSTQGIVISPARASAGRRRWRIELGGRSSTRVRLAPGDTASQRRRQALVRTATSYEFSARGVDVVSQWRLDVPQDALRQMELSLDAGLQLVSVRYGDTLVPWTLTAPAGGGESKAEPARVAIEFPEPLRGTGRVLRLTAMAPLEVDEVRRLPTIRPLGLAWGEGTINLLVPSPFVIRQLTPVLCRQTKSGALPAPLTGESVELQCFAPEASVELAVARRRENVRVAIGTSLTLSSGEVQGTLVADLRLTVGERFTLRAGVSEAWLIDSVEAVPADAISDWTVGAGESPSAGQQLTIRLAKALTPNHPIRLVIRGRGRSSPLGKQLGQDDLRMLDLQGATPGVQLLALRASGGYQLRLDDQDDLVYLDPHKLTDAQRELFVEELPEIVFPLDPRAAAWRVAIVPLEPRYTAEVLVEVTATAQGLSEVSTIRCQPTSGRIERLVVQFNQSRPDRPRWTLGSDVRGQFTARRIAYPGDDPALAAGESWELTLKRPRATPFEVRAVRTAAIEGETPVSLAAVPQADSQRGEVVVRAAGDLPLSIANRRLRPMYPAAAAEGEYATVRAAYRYEPAEEAAPGAPPALVLAAPPAPAAQAGAAIWRLQLDSRYEPSGGALHRAVALLRNNGQLRCTLDLPPGAELQSAWLDDRRLDQAGPGPAVEFALPPGHKFVSLAVEFSTRDAAWGNHAAWLSPDLKFNLPVLAKRWTVWLPPDYELLSHGGWLPRDTQRPSWPQRLFGVLSRPQQQLPFDPTSADDWLSLVDVSPARDAALARAQVLLGELANRRSSTWGETLAAAAARAGDPALLLVDAAALDEAGLGAASPLPPFVSVAGAEDDSAGAGMALLEQAGLALVVAPRAALLTTSARAAAHRWQLTPAGSSTLQWVLPGPWRRRIDAASLGAGGELPTVATWRTTPPAPWQSPRGPGPTAGMGWSAYRLEAVHAAAEVFVIRRATAHLAVWLVFLGAVAVGRRGLAGRTAWQRGVAVLAAAAALALPAALAPLASAVLLAMLFCLAVEIILPRRRPATLEVGEPAAPPPAWAAAMTLAVLAGGLALIVGASRLKAAEPRPETRTYSVFIPTAADGQPSGGRYQVPSEFWEELQRRQSVALGSPQGWLLRNARYDVTLGWDESQTNLEVREFLARYEVQTFEPLAQVQIPLGPFAADSVPSQAVVDGRPLPVHWDARKRLLSVEVNDVGPSLIELSLRVGVKALGEGTGLELSVPRVAASTLQLHVPPGAPRVDVPTARGAAAWSQDRETAELAIGPTDKLHVQWSGAGKTATADVDVLLWLKVLSGSVVADARLLLKPVDGPVGEVRLELDPRLRVLPPAAQDSIVAEVRGETGDATLAGETRSVVVRLARPASEPTVVPLSFLLTGTAGIGQLRVPRLELPSVRAVRRWLAVSIDPALEFEAQQGEPLTSMAVANFAAQWDEPRALPNLAYELPRSEPAWTLATRPRPPVTTARQSLAISFYQGGAVLDFDSSLTTTEGHTFQHQLRAPEDFDVESVSVFEDGVQRAVQWSRSPEGLLTVFLNAPLAGDYRLALRGSVRTPSSGTLPLPIIRLLGVKSADESISLFRQRAVLVTIDDLRGLSDAPETARLDNRPEAGRLARALVVTGDDPAATVTLAPNEPHAEATQVTTLRREAAAWHVEVDCTWTVREGLLDVLRLEAPASWTGPWKLDPPVASEAVDVPGRNARHFIIRPRSAVRDTFRLSIAAPLGVAPGEPVTLPDIVPLGVEKAERYVRLPVQLGVQQAVWETAELQAAPLPAPLEEQLSAEAARTYRVIGSGPLARLRAVENVAAPRRVRLADVHVAWTADGRYQGLATFDLDAGGVMSWRLGAAPGCRLLEGLVDGRAVTFEPSGENRWTIPAALGELPQRIEVLFSGALSTEAGGWDQVRLEAPVLVDLPVEKTLWTVYAPADHGSGVPETARWTSPWQQELARLEALTGLLDVPEDLAASLTASELRQWFEPWRRRWQFARDAVRRRFPQATPTGATVEAEAEAAALDRQFARVVARLGLGDAAEGSPAGAQTAAEPSALWELAFGGGRPPTTCTLPANQTGLVMRYPRAEGPDALARLSWAVGLLLLAGIVSRLPRWGAPLADWLRRWPHVLGVIAGLAWWLWLQPSVLGLGLALVCLAASFRSGLRPAREASSSIVRIGGAG